MPCSNINDYLSDNSSRCSSFSIDEFNTRSSLLGDHLTLFHQNIRSYHKNFDEFCAFVGQCDTKIDVIILTETWLKDDETYEINGYVGYHVSRKERRGGGVTIYVRDCFISNVINSINVTVGGSEVLGVRISIRHDLWYNVIGIYRPPSDKQSILHFNSVLMSEILSKFRPDERVITAGDININLYELGNPEKEYIDAYRSLGYCNRGCTPRLVCPTLLCLTAKKK